MNTIILKNELQKVLNGKFGGKTTQQIYLEYVNDYLMPEIMAEHYSVHPSQMIAIIKKGKKKHEKPFLLDNNPYFDNWHTAHFFIVSIFTANKLHKRKKFKHVRKLGPIETINYFKEITDQFENKRERYSTLKLIGEERYTIEIISFLSSLK